ncbi:MAG TPA: FAD-linked oxidase C-terminal domain-containing protein [Bryobacteraceae bacterium]|nr:FAD-linked oxidase C-terminal domain-containing protein [Bryobacteraceae bacterium]
MTTLIAENQIAQAAPTRLRPGDVPAGYAHELAAELSERIEGEVRFDSGSRALYATDGSNYRQVPIGVVVPKTIDDVVATVNTARKFGAPILARGGGTSLCGQCCNVAVVLDFSKYLNRLIHIDAKARQATVQPGIVLDWLRKAAERYTLTFGPDPATHNHNTLGGMIGNNSCGVHAVMAGKTEENIDELEILTYDGARFRVGPTSDDELERIIREGGRRGEIYAGMKRIRDKYADLIRQRYPKIPRRVSGYNLNELLPENGFHVARALVGSECTLALTLEAKCKLVWSPPARTLVVLGYPDVFHAADHIMEVMDTKPIGCEAVDEMLVSDMKEKGLHVDDLNYLPDGRGWLLVEFGGHTKEESDANARKMMDALKGKPNAPSMKLYDKDEDAAKIWEVRESGLGASAWVPGQHVTWEGWEDSAVAPEKLGAYLRDLCSVYDKHGYKGALYGHFGQGCVHTRITFDFYTAEGIANYRRFMDDATTLVTKYGGSLSGEHGDGQSKAEFLYKMFGDELIGAFNEFKRLWDPEWKMNPGKVVEPYRIDENLRLGTDYNPPQVKTHFHFLQDGNNFAHASLRCVGVGECRRQEKGTMCPSYRATMEEKHSTRGRAHMLFEMMQGEVIRDGWKSDEVYDALDLCLSCKGCKHDCPVNVDMATYKAEFLSHYYEGRLRPRYAYAMGWINKWAELASLFPEIANLMTQTPGLSGVMKAAGGISQERRMPKFARQTFRSWFRRGRPRAASGQRVLLWADTFNNYFHPEVAAAAVDVLEAAGYQVVVPEERLCCGRPLYDYGFLDMAKSYLYRILKSIRRDIEDGTPIVGLEPSCVAVFRDELTDLLPHDHDAQRLSKQAFTLGEFLEKKADHYTPPKLDRKLIVHGHCHHKAVVGMSGEMGVLKKMGADAHLLDDGCCGMAGSFGFEEDKYDVSMRVFAHELHPHVDKAAKDTILVADGFSCRTQIEDGTDRRALHLAQVIKMALDHGPNGVAGPCPERAYQRLERNDGHVREWLTAGVAAGLIGGGLLAWKGYRH